MLIDVWGLMKAYVSAKDKSVVAEKFVDIAMDNGVEDEELKELIGHDDELDEAIVNEWALLRNKWLGVIKALDQKQWHITNIVKLRVAGMEDANL